MTLGEAFDGYLEKLEERQKRFAGLTHEQRVLIHIEDAISEYRKWVVKSNNFIEPEDKFRSWLDANYPDLYEEHSDFIWQAVRR